MGATVSCLHRAFSYPDFVQKPTITAEVTDLACRAGAAANAESVFVFGSCARGEACEDSDVDLALVVPEQSDARVALRAAIRATMHRQVPLDLVVLHRRTAVERRTMLAREVRQDGILVYGRPL